MDKFDDKLQYSLFKLADGAVVGAVGAQLVNAAAWLMGYNGVNTATVAAACAVGSLLFGLYTREKNVVSKSETMKERWKQLDGLDENPVAKELFVRGIVNISGATAGYLPAFTLFGANAPGFGKLMLAAGLGTVAETAYSKLTANPEKERLALKLKV